MNITFEEAMSNIASSIISEQTAITSLLEQEAAKVDRFVELGASPDELLSVNDSVTEMVTTTNTFDDILKNKLLTVTKYLDY